MGGDSSDVDGSGSKSQGGSGIAKCLETGCTTFSVGGMTFMMGWTVIGVSSSSGVVEGCREEGTEGAWGLAGGGTEG